MTRPTQSRHPTQSLVQQAAELAIAVPQVVVHRLARMASAGLQPSARDRQEFQLMSDEKSQAFQESWLAMAEQAAHVSQQLALSIVQTAWLPWVQPEVSLPSASSEFACAAVGIANKGMEPVHRRAVANAKRLKRIRLG